MHIDDFEAELQFAFGDARDVQQIVDQSGLQFDISSNDFQRLAQFGRMWRRGLQFTDHCDDRRERVAQFV